MSHIDTRALAFRPSNPFVPAFLASDGGLDWSSNRWGWTPMPIGSGPGKINALQLYGVSGQAARGEGGYRLAFGTQDNDLWSSADDGVSWPEEQRTGAEGGGMQMKRILGEGETDKWTYTTCGGGGCGVRISDPLFQGQQNWPGYASRPGWGFSAPQKIADGLPGWYSQIVYPDTDELRRAESLGLELTRNYGDGYFRIYDIPEEVRGVPVNTNHSVKYLAVVRGRYGKTVYDGISVYRDVELLRVRNLGSKIISAEYPAMNRTGGGLSFGSMGHYAFQFAWMPVFAVDPHDENHIIAPDVEYSRMMVSRDGGNNWSEIPGLADRITQGGRLAFSIPDALSDYEYSLVSSISFFPENPQLVILGLQQGGAYISADGGTTWRFVLNSERINNITGFHWKSANEIYVASYGRGLWKINAGPIIATSVLASILESDLPGRAGQVSGVRLDPGTRFVPLIGSEFAWGQSMPLLDALKSSPSQFDALVIAVNGEVTELAEGKTIEERVKMTPGASWLYFTDQPPENQLAVQPGGSINLTDNTVISNPSTDQTNPPGNELGLIVGVTFRNDIVVGIVSGVEAAYLAPTDGPKEFTPVERETPSGFDGAYVTLEPSGPLFFGGPIYSGADTLHLRGYGFKSPNPIEIFIDGRRVESAIQPNADGEFRSELSLKGLVRGSHQLRVVQRTDSGGENIDTRLFMIRSTELDIPANDPPVANAGPDQTVERTSVAGASATLDGSGSSDPDGDALTYNWTWGGGSASGVNPTVTVPPGLTTITLTVSDGKFSSTDTVVVNVVDTTPPVVAVIIPKLNGAVQDGVALTAEASDISGVASVSFYVREPGNTTGVPIGYEGLAGTFNGATGKWEYNKFDTTLLQDGYYVILAKAVDNYGNEGWCAVVPFSIRNWAVIELLPESENNKAGRTMPVKFALRISSSVDPGMPFVYNEDLEIRIYDTAKPTAILQRAIYGIGARDYRIDTVSEKYITNFQTAKTPATYGVEIWRPAKNFKVGGFTFKTVK